MTVDLGASSERTALAWDRTALTLMGGSAIIARLTYDRLGPVVLGPLGVSLCLSALVVVAGRARYRRDAPRGGRAPFGIAVATIAIATSEAAALLR